MSDKSVDILILGAGLSGLSAAFQLSKKVRFVKTQCGNLVIFLSLIFYVKSIVGIVEVQNLLSFKAVTTHFESLNFDFYELFTF